MKEENEDDGQFKMRLETMPEAIEEQVIPAEINDLKLEKISQRVTMISVLIPVLIVIVLVITYLDIKKRVTQTEDSGEIEFQKLSADLESRFSSLSVRQARIEDSMQRLGEQNDQTIAAVQVRLEKVSDGIKKVGNDAVGRKDFDATKAELAKQLGEAVEATNLAGQQTAAISQELKKQMDQLNQGLAAADGRLTEFSRKISQIDETKIDKAGLDVALRLEALKIENALKTRIEALQSKVEDLENQIPPPAPSRAPAVQSAPQAAPAPKPVVKPETFRPTTPSSGDQTAKPGASSPGKIEEQNIGK